MPDVKYIFKKAKRTAPAYIQRRCMLWPLMRRKSLFESAVIEDTQKLLKWWRTKLRTLRDVGWKELQSPGKLQFARNCPPTAVVALSDTIARPCHLAQICPWCHSRDAVALYGQLAAFLPTRGAVSNRPLKLVEVYSKRQLTVWEIGAHIDAAIRNWRTVPHNTLKQIAPLGAYYGIACEPQVIAGQELHWKLTSRVLAIVKQDWTLPDGLSNGVRRCRVSVVKSRKQLVPIVARTCRYPVGLLKADAEYVMLALNARRGIRCKALTGSLRAKRSKS